MNALQHFRGDLGRAWENLTLGWQELRSRASEALTHFHWKDQGGELQTADDHFIQKASRWAFLAAEVSENDQQVEVRLEVPGMDPDGFDIQVVDDWLVVRGEKQLERERSDGEYHLMERAYGRFQRALQLPCPVDDAGARAKYRRGVLRISLPKSTPTSPRRIAINSP